MSTSATSSSRSIDRSRRSRWPSCARSRRARRSRRRDSGTSTSGATSRPIRRNSWSATSTRTCTSRTGARARPHGGRPRARRAPAREARPSVRHRRRATGVSTGQELNELNKRMSGRQASRDDAATFDLIPERWREHGLDPRLVATWTYEAAADGVPRLGCALGLDRDLRPDDSTAGTGSSIRRWDSEGSGGDLGPHSFPSVRIIRTPASTSPR